MQNHTLMIARRIKAKKKIVKVGFKEPSPSNCKPTFLRGIIQTLSKIDMLAFSSLFIIDSIPGSTFIFSLSCIYDIITICHQNSTRSSEYDPMASV